MKKLKLSLLVILTSGLIACTSFNAGVFNSERIATTLVSGSYQAYNNYYHSKTNGNNTLDVNLESQRNWLNQRKQEFGKTILLIEKARLDYLANPTATNKVALTTLVDTSNQQANVFSTSVKSFIKQ